MKDLPRGKPGVKLRQKTPNSIYLNYPLWEQELIEKYKITESQMRVLKLIITGQYHKDTAMQLGLQEKSVKFHCGRIYKLLGIRSRSELAVFIQKLQNKFEHQNS